VVIKLVIYW